MSKTYFKVIAALLLLTTSLSFISNAEEQFSSDKDNAVENVATDDNQKVNSPGKETEEVKVAPNLDLKEVAPPQEPVLTSPKDEKTKILPATSNKTEVENKDTAKEKSIYEGKDFPSATAVKIKPGRKKLVVLGSEVPPSTSTRLAWTPEVNITGLALPTPVLVINGRKPGPTICLISAIHGDELNGIEVVRRVMYDIKPKDLSGTIIGVPIVNLHGFQLGSRYLSDRRDLNRFFPGHPTGSLASRIAHSLFTEIVDHCDYLIDLHTGSFRRNNLPQIRANMADKKVAEFVKGFDKIAIVHSSGSPGMLRTAANDAGIISITMELGESLRIQENQIVAGTHSVNSLLDQIDMYPRVFIWGEPKPAYYQSTWIRVESGGILFSKMGLGDTISVGDILGIVTDPITNQSVNLIAPINGHIIGMAVNQVVIPGFAAYHIGIESNQEDMTNTDTESQLDINPNGEVEPE